LFSPDKPLYFDTPMKMVIRFDHVSKRFRLHHHNRTLREMLAAPFRKAHVQEEEAFWPLRDLSFEVAKGETVGIVGPNGVGKSTILKLIARILEPTSGTITTHGRIGTLLELGAGFHPDLSGRENIYLNGAVMGMDRHEIERKFPAIVEFAGLGRFIDMPVKHYSSGMYVRLGFSVAIHADPDILLIDEVLSVGDAEFQRRCLEKIDELRENGVTILFVSHAAEAVRAVCSRALWLDEGRLVADGPVDTVVMQYLDETWRRQEGRPTVAHKGAHRWGSGRAQITAVHLLDGAGKPRQQFHTGEPLTVEIHYRAAERIVHPVFGIAIHRRDGVHIAGPNTHFDAFEIPFIEGEGVVRFTVPALPLLKGLYFVSVAVHNEADTEIFDYHNRMYAFRVLESANVGYGLMRLSGRWSLSADVGSQAGRYAP